MGIKISELESTTIANANDVFIINQNGATKKITKKSLASQISNPDLEERVEELEEKVTNLEETVDSELEDGTATGTEITVNDSATADASLDIGGNTEQAQRNYKGLLMVPEELSKTTGGITFKVNNDGSVTVTGTSSSAGNISMYLKLKKPLTLNGTYTFSLKTIGTAIPNTQQWHLREGIGTTSIFASVVTAGDTSSVTKEVNVTINYLQIYITTNRTFNCTIYPILEEGSTATDWDSATTNTSPNPDYIQDIHVLKGSNAIKIINKNLLKLVGNTSHGVTGVLNDDGSFTLAGTIDSNWSNITLTVQEFLKRGTYTFSISKTLAFQIRLRAIHADETYEEITIAADSESTSRTLTQDAVAYYVYIIGATSGTTINEKIFIQLEKGSTVSSYEPHKEVTKTLTLPNGMEMCKIGDYKDEFVKDLSTGKWYKDEKITKTVFDGSENWAISTTQGIQYFRLPPLTNKRHLSESFCYCNYLSYISQLTAIGSFGIRIGNNEFLQIKNNNTTTLEEFKNWLSQLYANGTPVVVYYILREPVQIEITDETLIAELDEPLELRTYFGQTNITVEAEDAKPYMTLNYKKSNRVLRSEIDTIKARLDLLEG